MLIHETRGVVDLVVYDDKQILLAAVRRDVGVRVFLFAHGYGWMCVELGEMSVGGEATGRGSIARAAIEGWAGVCKTAVSDGGEIWVGEGWILCWRRMWSRFLPYLGFVGRDGELEKAKVASRGWATMQAAPRTDVALPAAMPRARALPFLHSPLHSRRPRELLQGFTSGSIWKSFPAAELCISAATTPFRGIPRLVATERHQWEALHYAVLAYVQMVI
jgi:hypothetical protein